MNDREIDQEIMYSDHSDRVVIWQHVVDYRAELEREALSSPFKPGPDLIVTEAEVRRVRARLAKANLPHGYEAIAKAGGWSVSTVRRRLGVLR